MGLLRDLTDDARRLNRELGESHRLLDLSGAGGGGAPRRVSGNDFRRLRGDIRQLGRQVAGLGGRGGVDPFLKDLARDSGPRRV